MPKTTKTNKTTKAETVDITARSADFEFDAVPVKEAEAPNYTRRIQMLMAAIIIAVGTYSAAWFWFGSQLVKGAEVAIGNAALKGQSVTCEQPTAKGYPFRMGLSCAKTGLEIPAQGLNIAAGAFRSAAQIYEPTRIIGELDGPLNFLANHMAPITVNWALARASVNGIGGLPKRISVEIEKPVVAETAAPNLQTASANLGAFHMRQSENNQIDLASTIDNAKLKGSPAFNFSSDAFISGATRFDAAIKSRTPIIEIIRGNQGELRNASLAFEDGSKLSLSGPFSLSPSGLLSATLALQAENAGNLIDNLSKVIIAFGAKPINLNALKALALTDQIKLTITIKDGAASIGFIPLGTIPPL